MPPAGSARTVSPCSRSGDAARTAAALSPGAVPRTPTGTPRGAGAGGGGRARRAASRPAYPPARGGLDSGRGVALKSRREDAPGAPARLSPPSRKMFVYNEWVAASNGATYAVPNPATEEPVGAAPEATVEDMRRAIAAARRAFDEGPWPRSSRQERARVIPAIADGMERRKEELRQMLIAEAGATSLTHDIQLEQPIRLLRNYADLALTFDFEEPLPVRVTDGPLGTFVCSSIVHRQPAGVCGLIPTWNFPLFVTAQKLGPALATGCTMVFKPSPYGPLVNLMLAEIVADADLPPGVVNFVTGQSNAIAETLVTDPRIDKVSFTGSVATGEKIMAAAGASPKPGDLQ